MAGLADWMCRRRAASEPPPAAAGALDFEAADFVRDPYPYYARLRRDEPLHQSAGGAWVLSRHADVLAALADARLGNAPAAYAVIAPRNRDRYLCADVAANTLPFLDGEEHDHLRRVLAQAWTAHLRERPPDIEAHVGRLLSMCRARAHFDLLHDFASPLAVAVIGDVLGVPDAMRLALHADARYFFYLFTRMPSHEIRAQTDAALARLRDGFGRLLDGLDAPLPGLLVRLRDAPAQGIGRVRLIDNLVLLWADGIGNVEAGIASAFAVLLRHPEQWRALCAEPALARSAAAECLRFEPPGQFIGRIVREECDWHGHTLRRDTAVLLLLASANRDEDAFAHAGELDIRRAAGAPLTFGRGHHSCLGAALARLEVEAALRVAAQTLPGLRLERDALVWRRWPGHRWLESLPVRAS